MTHVLYSLPVPSWRHWAGGDRWKINGIPVVAETPRKRLREYTWPVSRHLEDLNWPVNRADYWIDWLVRSSTCKSGNPGLKWFIFYILECSICHLFSITSAFVFVYLYRFTNKIQKHLFWQDHLCTQFLECGDFVVFETNNYLEEQGQIRRAWDTNLSLIMYDYVLKALCASHRVCNMIVLICFYLIIAFNGKTGN